MYIRVKLVAKRRKNIETNVVISKLNFNVIWLIYITFIYISSSMSAVNFCEKSIENPENEGKVFFYFGYEQLVYISLFLPSWIFNRRFMSNYTLRPLSQNYNWIIISKCILAIIDVISAQFSKSIHVYDAFESHSSLPFGSTSKKPIPTTVSWTEGIFVSSS